MKLTPRMYARALVSSISDDEASAQSVMKKLLKLLQKKKQMKMLPKIIAAFEELWAEKNGILKIKMDYPSAFKDSLDEFAHTLTSALGKKIAIESRASDDLIGGLRLVYNNTLIDGSIQGQLRRLKQRL